MQKVESGVFSMRLVDAKARVGFEFDRKYKAYRGLAVSLMLRSFVTGINLRYSKICVQVSSIA